MTKPIFTLSLQCHSEVPYPSHLSEHEAWLPVESLKIPFEDKSFLLGFIHALQLNNHQVREFLQCYTEHWQRAEHYEKHPNRKRNTGRRSANDWITNGCIGFIERL